MRNKLFNAIIVFMAFVITCAAIASGSYFNTGLIMAVGYRSEILVRAPRNVENRAQTQRNRDAARVLAEGLAEVFTLDPGEWAIVENNLRHHRRTELEIAREAYRLEREAYERDLAVWEALRASHEVEAEQTINRWQQQADAALVAGTPPPPVPTIEPPPERPEFMGEAILTFPSPVGYSEAQQQFILEMTDEHFELFWHAVESAAFAVQTTETIHVIDFMTERAVQRALTEYALDRITDEIAEEVILFSLSINAVSDEALNLENFEREAANYEIATIQEGTIIVDEGWYVTQEIYDILLDLDMLAPESLFDNIFPMLGVFFLTAVLFLVCLMYLAAYRPAISANFKEKMLLLSLYLLVLVLVWTLGVSFPFLPILIFPMLVSILIDRRCAAVFSFSLIIIFFFVIEGDLTYLLFYTASAMLFCMFSRYTTERGKSIWVGLLVSAIMFALAVAVSFIVERNAVFDDVQGLFITAGFAALSGILTVFLCMGSLPLWETFFGVVTPVKLLDLTNPTNLLLRRLTIEAPGTYHHSLIVANLAETAAYDIGANAHAARVGGYYHDVGKLKFPHYFVENLDGENPHDHLDPINSAQLIMSHVSYGLTLASEHRLPQFVRDMIMEHHGTTLLQFFYSKARETGVQCDEKDFRYPHTIPQTKESACVMLADSVEAAVRSMIPKMQSVDEVEKTIRFIIRGKLNDGQLADSQLSIRDVIVIEESFFRVLKGMYHERIAYPAPKKKIV
ncbi:MAG: HDIG domain-containing protein [Defluviitaleaceae bacterium]|nr:HDIG domain-containing protein [Defluviitaleaceae bacterium]